MSNKRCRQCGWPFGINPEGLCLSCAAAEAEPDDLSKRKTLGGVPFVDMKSVDETKRIEEIVKALQLNRNKNIMVIVDAGGHHEGKGDRYLNLIREKLPQVVLVRKTPGPVPESEAIVVKLP